MPGAFTRVVCSVDGSLESIEAARQVSRLAPRTARLVLLGVARPLAASPLRAGVVMAPGPSEAAAELRRARERIPELRRARLSLLEGAPIPTLLGALRRESATLVAVGIHRRSRALGVALGSVATALLHGAPCSVYVGRGPFGVTRLPRRIVVGVDGSRGAYRALEEAAALAGRIRAEVCVLVALGSKDVDLTGLEERMNAVGVVVVEDPRRPVDALLAAGAELLVLGGRGIHGLRALGSVSERVAHQARCPVLVVRPEQWAPSARAT